MVRILLYAASRMGGGSQGASHNINIRWSELDEVGTFIVSGSNLLEQGMRFGTGTVRAICVNPATIYYRRLTTDNSRNKVITQGAGIHQTNVGCDRHDLSPTEHSPWWWLSVLATPLQTNG